MYIKAYLTNSRLDSSEGLSFLILFFLFFYKNIKLIMLTVKGYHLLFYILTSPMFPDPFFLLFLKRKFLGYPFVFTEVQEYYLFCVNLPSSLTGI